MFPQIDHICELDTVFIHYSKTDLLIELHRIICFLHKQRNFFISPFLQKLQHLPSGIKIASYRKSDRMGYSTSFSSRIVISILFLPNVHTFYKKSYSSYSSKYAFFKVYSKNSSFVISVKYVLIIRHTPP